MKTAAIDGGNDDNEVCLWATWDVDDNSDRNAANDVDIGDVLLMLMMMIMIMTITTTMVMMMINEN